MLALTSSLKRRWHEELVADPVSHAWVLNLYRAGEEHPDTVDDYFPVEHAPAWLAHKLARHRDQERTHAGLYKYAVRKLEQELEQHTGLDVFNVAIRAHTHASFGIDDDDSVDTRTQKLAHFLAHAHFLEARIAVSLDLHLDACVRAGKGAVARVVQVVLADEVEHARYTREAVFDLVPRAQAREILAVHRRGEARANLAFSARQVRAHTRRHPSTNTRLWRFCAFLMEGAEAHV